MKLILYGKILKKHGLKGEVKVLSFSSSFENFDSFDSLYLSFNNSEPKRFFVEYKRYHKNFALVKFEGINTPEDADTLHGAKVLIETKLLPETEEDEYYWFQLIGMDVVTPDQDIIGQVSNLLDNSSQPILVVKNNSNEFLIPMVDKFVKKIDTEKSRIHIEPIEGLLD